jgi:hypothetical protein
MEAGEARREDARLSAEHLDLQAGIVGDYRLSKYVLVLPIRTPELMEVTMMSRQVAR